MYNSNNLTMIKVNAEMSSVGQGVLVYKITLRVLHLLSFQGELLLCKRPKLALR
jgi:hypothetical protein